MIEQERKMFKGDWSCSGCGAAITELPFEPRNTENLTCRDCFMQNRANKQNDASRQMHEGDWKCSGCGGAITQLPFQPRDTSNLKCRDCFIKSKG